MVSLSSGQLHYHTLKSDVISFLIQWFIWLTILFSQQKFKICRYKKKTRTKLCQMKQQPFRCTKRKYGQLYIYFFVIVMTVDQERVQRVKYRPKSSELASFLSGASTMLLSLNEDDQAQNNYPT